MSTPLDGVPYTSPDPDDQTLQVRQDRLEVDEEFAQRIADSAALSSSYASLVGEAEVTGSAAAALTISDIPAGGGALLVVTSLRGDGATAATGLNVGLNGDSTDANYTRQRTISNGTSVATTAASDRAIGQSPRGGAPANSFGSGRFVINDYAGSGLKVVSGESMWLNAAADARFITGCVVWANTAAVTSVTVSHSSGNLVVGSKVAVYRLPFGA